MRPRYHYELGWRRTNAWDEDTMAEGYLIFDRAAGNSPERAIAMTFDVADAERIVALLNAASP